MTQIIVKSRSASHLRPLIQVAIDHEVRVLKIGLQKTMRHLRQFEQHFGIASQEFYQDYQTGKFGDDMQYMKWAGEYETLLQLQEEYAEIKGTLVC